MTNGKEYLLKPDFAKLIEQCDAFTKVKIISTIEHYIVEFNRYKDQIDPEDIAHSFNEFINEKITADIKNYSGIPISCKKGCSYCCSINVDISEQEALLIIKYCKKNDICIDWNVLKKQSMYTVNSYRNLPKRLQKCIFLDNMGSCKIYDVRPVNCRLLFSIDNPKKCDLNRGVKNIAKFLSIEAEAIGTALATASNSSSMSETLLKLDNKGF